MDPFPTQTWQRPVTTWVYKPEAGNTVYSCWWWTVCRSKYAEPSINFGIINSITRLHLVGYFYWFYSTVVQATLRHCLQQLDRIGYPPNPLKHWVPGPVHLLSSGLRMKITKSRLNITTCCLIADITMYSSPVESYHLLSELRLLFGKWIPEL
jgi:hypothetical protein